jgi:hypothetical protein
MSKAKRTHDVVATAGTYKDRDGNEKKRYLNCGSAFTDDEGRVSIKVESIPVGPDWSGWLSLYPVKEREGVGAQQASRGRDGRGDGGDDIPF